MMSYVAAPFFERALPGARLGPVPKVVYIDRQASKRRLRHEDHLGLMDTLLSLRDSGRIAFKHAKLEDLSHAEQVTMVSDADVSRVGGYDDGEWWAALTRVKIIVGVHGNGLTHLLWMPQGGNVVEVSPHAGGGEGEGDRLTDG
jgi:capsular polysaccharide biosynthesis protein